MPSSAEAPAASVPVGPATRIGLAAALLQFAGAVALFLADQTVESIAALTTGTTTLVTVLYGRYQQARDEIKAAARVSPAQAALASLGQTSSIADEVRSALADVLAEHPDILGGRKP